MERHEILEAMGELKLYGMRASFDEIAGKGLARRDELYPLIASLIRAERTHRQARSISYRIGGAKFPVLKDLDKFVFPDKSNALRARLLPGDPGTGVRRAIETGVHIFARLPIPEIRSVVIVRPDVIHVLGRDQDLEKLYRMRAPSRHVTGELLKHQNGVLSAPKRDRMSDFGAGTGDRWSHSMHRLIADQVADIRNDPRCAGLNELVVVDLFEIFLYRSQLFSDQQHERLERPWPLLLSQLCVS